LSCLKLYGHGNLASLYSFFFFWARASLYSVCADEWSVCHIECENTIMVICHWCKSYFKQQRFGISNSRYNHLNVWISKIPFQLSPANLETSVLFDLMAGSLLSVTKQWNSGDHLSLQLPIVLRTEAIKGW
jgi:hypothetical protein